LAAEHPRAVVDVPTSQLNAEEGRGSSLELKEGRAYISN
jgi:hypothetical protein